MTAPRSILRIALDLPSTASYDYLIDVERGAGRDDLLGRRALVPWGRGRAIGVVLEVLAQSDLPAGKLRLVEAILDDLPALPPDWLAYAEFAARYYQRGSGETILQVMPDPLRSADRYRRGPGGWSAPAIARALKRLAVMPAARGGDLPPALTSAQQEALAQMRTDAAAAPAALLLHGVTGSGKTEVYLHAVAEVLADGRQALVLVPEINLTPQLLKRFSARFARQRLFPLHSGLTEGERTLAWIAAATDQADIILGTRLAVFAPLTRLGVVVVDEEHDASYKQQEGMRYSARDLAVWRAKQLGIPIVLGSATPALETWWNAQSGRYRRVTLPARARAGAAMPRIELVDIRADPPRDGLSTSVRAALIETRARGEQSLVFLNRRGYAPVLACAACGWVATCRRCTAHTVFHKADGRLHCHHCGWEVRVPTACPTCGNVDLAALGRGTQRVEEGLAQTMPGASIVRIDADSTRRKGSAQAMFERVHSGEIDVLVGTQMVAKGHDFERVTLVAVLGADAALFSHDFRAPERLFQQLMQVAGRSGRAEVAGRVLVQTRYAEHPLFAALVAHDYARYAELLLEDRRSAGLPPFTFQAILRAEAKKLDAALEFLAQAKAAALGEGVRAYDPVPMALTRRAGIERAQLLVESNSRARLQAFLPVWIDALGGRAGGRKGAVKWHVEVDPLEI